ncbi:OpgC domain-containing protein [Candidatus Sumerlaeota bacterium]|nr:OpgC domain-containing protein [Candidatus Sumerlaeota bacterium]
MSSSPQGAGRDRAIDALRGIAILCMIADHTAHGSHILTLLHLPNYLQGSSGFVLMAGFALGMVSLRRAGKLGWSGAYRKVLTRAFQIYLIHVFLVLVMSDIGLATGNIRSVPTAHITFSQLIADILTLRWLPTYMDILPMYVILLLFTPLALECFRRGKSWLVFLVSFPLYAALQLDPSVDNFEWMRPNMGLGFGLWGWQLIFFLGLAAGYSRVDRTLKSSSRLRNVALSLSLVVVIGSIVLARIQAGDVGGFRLLSPEMEQALVRKDNHAPLRTLSIVAGAIVFYLAITALNDRGKLQTALAFLEVCGRSSLFVFIGHFAFVALRFAIGAKHWPPIAQDVWCIFVVSCLYAVTRWHAPILGKMRSWFASIRPISGSSPALNS